MSSVINLNETPIKISSSIDVSEIESKDIFLSVYYDNLRRYIKSLDKLRDSESTPDLAEYVLSTCNYNDFDSIITGIFYSLQLDVKNLSRLPSSRNDVSLLQDIRNIKFKLLKIADRNRLSIVPDVAPLIQYVIDHPSHLDTFEILGHLRGLVRRFLSPDVDISVTGTIITTGYRRNKAGLNGSLYFCDASKLQSSCRKDLLRKNLKFLFIDVDGFYEKYFGRLRWQRAVQMTVNRIERDRGGNLLLNWPANQDEKSVAMWMKALYDQINIENNTRWIVTSAMEGKDYLKHENLPGILLTRTVRGLKGKNTRSKDVLIVGEFQETNTDPYSLFTIERLEKYVGRIFVAQPTRRFILGFSLCKEMLRLWAFDRSGPYFSRPFNIKKDPMKLVQIMVGFQMMSDCEYGFNSRIMERRGERFIILRGRKYYLEQNTVSHSRRIISRGTSCTKARLEAEGRFTHMIKTSWLEINMVQEGELMKLAKEKGVTYIPRYVDHGTMDVAGTCCISEMRAGMYMDGRKNEFWSGDYVDYRCYLNQVFDIDYNDLPTSVPYRDRTEQYIIMSPLGISLRNADSALDIVGSIYGAICGHRSLYEKANILHQDVSVDNIVVTEIGEFESDNLEKRGMLIDLDVAKLVNDSSNRGHYVAGSPPFMAIDKLIDSFTPLTVHNDLESFLYVLLWKCLRAWDIDEDNPERYETGMNITNLWLTERSLELARIKDNLLAKDNFENQVIPLFPKRFAELKPLARRFREILFDEIPSNVWNEAGDQHNPGKMGDRLLFEQWMYNALEETFSDTMKRLMNPSDEVIGVET